MGFGFRYMGAMRGIAKSVGPFWVPYILWSLVYFGIPKKDRSFDPLTYKDSCRNLF